MDDLGYPRFRKPQYVVRVGYTYIFSRVNLGVVTMFDVLSTSVKIGIWTNKHRGSSPSAMRTYKAQKCFDDGSKVQFRQEKCEDEYGYVLTVLQTVQQFCKLQSAIWLWINTYRYITIVGWTSIYQLFWGSLGTRVFDPLPFHLFQRGNVRRWPRFGAGALWRRAENLGIWWGKPSRVVLPDGTESWFKL